MSAHMDIRDALDDDYLAQFYDTATMRRARDYLVAVVDLEVVHESSSSLTATALVRGSAPQPYHVQFHAEVTETSDWVFSACSCPVARLCKHGAAVALRLRGRPRPAHEPVWRERLARLNQDLERRALSTLSGTALALEISRRPATRWSRGVPGDFSMRPMRPGARKGWVRSGAEWTDLSGPVARSRFIPAQAEALLALHRGLIGLHTYFAPGTSPALDDFGDRLVPALRAAVAAGVTLLPGAGIGSLRLSREPARVTADLTTRAAAAGGAKETVLEAFVEVDGRRWRGDLVTPVGRPTTSLVLVQDDDVLLTDLTEPLDEGLLDLLLGVPVVVAPDDLEAFLDALAPLARRLPLASSDGSLVVPTPPRPRLLLTVTWHSPTSAALSWLWSYGSAACPIGSADALGGLRDPELEREIVATVPAQLVAGSTVRGGDALALALHDLPHVRSLPDVDVVEEERPDFRETTAAPEIAFALAEQQPDHTDWLDLEVQVSVDQELVPLPDVLAALTRQDEFLVLPSGLYVALDRPEFSRLQEVVALAAQLREAEHGRISVGATDLSVWAELVELGVVDAQAATWVERATTLRDLTTIPQPEPVGLRTTLRPYQLEGFWWLAFLHDHGLGGILADDMGLGETLQVLALVQHALARGVTDGFLVVAPTSVVTAWRQQAALHAPGLRVGVVSRRTDDVAAIAREHDVVVTTYALLRLEREQFAGRHWSGLVLDEAQQVKNHQSKAYAAVRALDADFRLAVTGTPFENRLMELWSLLSIAAPGLYPVPRRFRDIVVGPVEKEGDAAALDRFRRRIRPFMLRRTKELVAADLPPKQEQVLEVELEARHRKVYDTHLAQGAPEDPRTRRGLRPQPGGDLQRPDQAPPARPGPGAGRPGARAGRLGQAHPPRRPARGGDGRRTPGAGVQHVHLLPAAGARTTHGRGHRHRLPRRRHPRPRVRGGGVPPRRGAGVPHQPEGRRGRADPDRGRLRLRARPLVEPRRRGPGGGPGAPDRAGQARQRLPPRRRRHHRGQGDGAQGPQGRALRQGDRRRRGLDGRHHRRRHPCPLRAVNGAVLRSRRGAPAART